MSVPPVEPLPEGTVIPHHIAFIPDGNRRWAKAHGQSIGDGYRAGFQVLKSLSQTARRLGVHTFTMWAFSTENWSRRPDEVRLLMAWFAKKLPEFRDEFHHDQVRFIHLGRKDRLPNKLLGLIAELEEETRGYTRHVVNVALDYGGRDEILRAVRRLIAKGVQPEAITEETLAAALDTAGQPHPNPDFVIRTSGEQRTSGFLIWQCAQSEFYWAPQHLPDFTPAHFRAALIEYSRRQ